jgi:hypothetical protein
MSTSSPIRIIPSGFLHPIRLHDVIDQNFLIVPEGASTSMNVTLREQSSFSVKEKLDLVAKNLFHYRNTSSLHQGVALSSPKAVGDI